MKKVLAFGLFLWLTIPVVWAGASSSIPAQRAKGPARTIVVVHKNFPLKRPLKRVIVRPVRVSFRVPPARFLPTIFWSGVVVTTPPLRDVLIWEDGETLKRDEDWSEIVLNCDNSGRRLWLEIVAGRVQFDWAEIVFGNGDAQVVDMKECVRGPGYYELSGLGAARKVDHVRIIARADSPEARVVLKIEK